MRELDVYTLNKCAFRTDAENEAETRKCKCPKIIMSLYHAGREYEVEVCRNYYAELFQRYYKSSYAYEYSTRIFEVAAMAKMEIIKEVFGCHICKRTEMLPGMYKFQKINPNNKNIVWLSPFWIANSYFSEGNHTGYMPFFYALIDRKCALRYPLDCIFGAICEIGIEKAVSIFGGYDVQLIVKYSIEKMIECLEVKNIRYKKSAVKPVLEKMRDLYCLSETERYEIKVITALSEILCKISNNEFKYR